MTPLLNVSCLIVFLLGNALVVKYFRFLIVPGLLSCGSIVEYVRFDSINVRECRCCEVLCV